MATQGRGESSLDRGTRLILRELRDLRVEMLAEARWERERKQSEALTRQVMQRSDERFQQALREFREDSVRQAAETRKMFKDIRVVGLSIVKTLNLHTQLLRGIDRKLGALGPWRPSAGNGRGA